MTAIHVLALLGWGALCAVWAGLLWAQRRVKRSGLMLAPQPTASPSPTDIDASVCVVIPARNEADTIGRCVTSVRVQDFPRLEVVVVDDRSEDATADAARTAAQNDPRVRLIQIDALPAGWMGKTHALWVATRNAQADWLLFLDADATLISPLAVRTAVAAATQHEAELLSLWPRHAAGGFAERLLIPLCGAVTAMWFGGAGRPGGPAFANGQFLLIRRETYERIGGHAAVRSALIEDVPLAERVQAAGARIWIGGGRDLVAVRMYDSLRAVIDGWARIFAGALRSRWKLGASIVWLLVGSLLPFATLPFLTMSALAGTPDAWTVAALGLCVNHMALMALVSWRFWGLGGCARWPLVLYPLSVVGVMWILVRAGWMLRSGGTVRWRDTLYRVDRRAVLID